ncbi:hypothetical protein, variant 1 [Aphanomyces invadans]|uniref:Uncharacterized protein n=1 Tax=Aphanomyces invadans TaxID=157072 RepID=A0A024U3Q1_9STRA|nr:hypothetical protein, variant 1 [Aphanomyces invadans]ETW00869.1 hypothetical protein, variant 1 [Aphanomyces invadans]|eukprot:XP_008871004.1 hypothetical protein, variant 1 [Aphanomyces invadans]
MCAIHLHTSFHQSVSLFVSARGMLGMPPALSEDLVTLRIAGKAYDITSAVTSARRMSEMLPSHARSLIELATSSTKSLEMSSKCLWQAAEKANAGFMVEFFATADDQITVQTCIEYKGRNQETPFLVACRLGHVQCVTILMHYGANVHAVDRHGNTGLHHACRQGHVALVQLLVGHVPVWLQNSSRLSALDLCRQQLRLRRRNVHMARCLECLENRVKLFEGWIELSEATVGSMLTGLRVLQAWNLRYVVVYDVGSNSHVDVAVYSIAHELRPLIPTTVYVVPILQEMLLNEEPKLLQPRPCTFALHGAPRRKDMFVGATQKIEFAAANPQDWGRWATFFSVTLVRPIWIAWRLCLLMGDVHPSERSQGRRQRTDGRLR